MYRIGVQNKDAVEEDWTTLVVHSSFPASMLCTPVLCIMNPCQLAQLFVLLVVKIHNTEERSKRYCIRFFRCCSAAYLKDAASVPQETKERRT